MLPTQAFRDPLSLLPLSSLKAAGVLFKRLALQFFPMWWCNCSEPLWTAGLTAHHPDGGLLRNHPLASASVLPQPTVSLCSSLTCSLAVQVVSVCLPHADEWAQAMSRCPWSGSVAFPSCVRFRFNEPWHCAHDCSLLVHRALRPCAVHRHSGASRLFVWCPIRPWHCAHGLLVWFACTRFRRPRAGAGRG